HGAPESHSLLELQRDRFRHKLRVQLRLMHFLNVDEDLALGFLREFLLELLDLGAALPDDDSRPRGADRHAQLIARAIDFDRADSSGLEPFMQRFFQLEVLAQQFRVVLLRKPPRAPRLRDAEPESVWMYLLSHSLLPA